MSFYASYPFVGGGSGGAGVSSLNSLTGAIDLISSDSSITINPSGSSIDLTTAGGGGGITSINTDTTAAQTLVTASTGTDFTITTTSGVSTFAIPTASASARGLLASADWTTFNNKQTAGNYLTALTGDVTASGPGSAAATIVANAVTNAKAAQMATLTLKGNNTGGTANASDLTVAQVNSILPVFTSTLNGLVPLSGGGTTTFLRADGTFAAPVAGSGTVTTVSVATANGFAGTVANATTTPAITLTTSVTGLLKGNGTTISTAGSSDLPTITLTGDVTGSASGGSIATTYAGVVPLLKGGTGTAAASANAAYNALSPMTTTGDIEYESATGIASRLALGSANQVLSVLGSQTVPSWQSINQAEYSNYLAANPGFEVNTTGYAAYANTAQATPVTGTGGSPTVTITRSTSTPLFGVASGLFTHGSSNQQGQGYSYDFTIDSAISTSATPCTVTGYYSVASGTYDSGLIVWIYDKTNSVLIPCSAATINNVIGAFPIQCEFQPNTNSTSYRLIFHCSTTTATAYTIQFDQLAVRPNTYNPGAAVTAWTAYTPTYGAGFGTVSTSAMFWRRVGDTLEVSGRFTAGTLAGSAATIGFPAGLTSATTSQLYNGTNFVGVGQINTNVANTTFGVLVSPNATSFAISAIAANNASSVFGVAGLTALNGNGGIGASTNDFSFSAKTPIVGWGVTQNLSSDTDTRVCTAKAYGAYTGGTTAAAIFPSVAYDTHSAYSTSTGKFTVQIPGFYSIGGFVLSNITNAALIVYKNGIADVNDCGFTGAGGDCSFYTEIQCNAQDTLELRSNGGTPGGGALSGIVFKRLSGPAQIAASESINMRAFSSTTTISGSLATVVYATKSFDSHNAYNATTGVYTCPAPGKYMAIAAIATSGTFALNNALDIQIQQSGSASQISESLLDAGGVINTLAGEVSDIFNCLAGDTLKTQVSCGASLPTIVSSNSKNYFSIYRVGN